MTWEKIKGNWRLLTGEAELRWTQVSDDRAVATVVDQTVLAPLRFVPVAKWAAKARPAVALNGKGEILIFHDKKLAFARRKGRWSYFAPETIVTPLARHAPVKVTISEVRDAVCAVSPGSSSDGTDDGDAVEHKDDSSEDADIVSHDGAPLYSPRGRVACLRRLLGHKPSFDSLDFALQEDIVTLEGATVLTLDGEILAARAVLLLKEGDPVYGRASPGKTFGAPQIHVEIAPDGYLQVFAAEERGPFLCFG